MKKLMKTVAAAAVALVASSSFASLPSPTDPVGFDAFTAGTKYTVSGFVERTDAGETSGSRYWYAITNASQEASAELATINNDSDAHGNYLAIDAQAPLYRTINASGEFGAALNADAEEIPASGIYLDTMVKFSVSSEEFKDGDLDIADKLAITCYSADDSGVTNIIVRAGYVGSSVVATNYVMTLDDFNVDEWHRLTVRAIADVGSSTAPVGFAVYLDQTLLEYGTDVAAGDQTYTDALNAAVKQNLYNSETRALLPSLVTTGVNKSKLTAVGFKGTGSLDDIQFTNEKPGFIVEGIAVSIAWDAGVATYTVIDSNNKTLVDAAATSGAAGSTNLTLDAGVTYLTVSATYANGYEAGEWTVTGDGAQISGGSFTVANGAELSIVSMLPKFDVGGTHYGTFEKALENATGTLGSPATIKLMADYTGDIQFDQNVANYIILDLAGKTLTGDEDAAIHTGVAVLTITNSTETIGHVVAPEDGLAVVCDGESLLTVTAGIFDGEIADDSGETATIVINAGTFYDPYYAVDQTRDFYLKSNVPDGTSISAPSDYYFTVGAAAPAPTPVAVVPTAATGLVYNGEAQTGVADGEGYTLTGTAAATDAGDYSATATLDEGYIWSDDTTEAKVFNWSIAAKTDAEVVVTLTSQIAEYTAQLAFPTASATIGNGVVEGTPAWNPAMIAEPNAGETNTYTVTFTVTTANYAGSTGTATFKVYKAAGGEYPTYIDPTDTETKAKYDTWKDTHGADTGSAHEDAFLLNCAPTAEAVAAAKANFKATITVNADGTVTVTAPGDYNVTPTIQGKQMLSDAEWHTKTDGDKFFRAVLEL